MRFVLIIALALVTVVPTASAQSKADIAKAKKYFQSGRQAYAAGQYRVAAIAFEQAYRLVQRPAILFSTAQSYRRHYFSARRPQDLKRALDLFKQYVATVKEGGRRSHAIGHVSNLEPLWQRIKATMPKAPDKPLVAPTQFLVSSSTPKAKVSLSGRKAMSIPANFDVKPGTYKLVLSAPGYFPREVQELAVKGRMNVVRLDLKPRPAILRIKAPAGARISIDGRIEGMAPLIKPLAVTAGNHYLTVTGRGHKPFARDLKLKLGERVDLNVKMKRTGQRRASYWIGGTAAATLLAGTVTSLMAIGAQSQAKDISDMFTINQMNIDDDDRIAYNDALNRRDRWRTLSYILYSSGAVIGVTAALLYWMDTPAAEAPRRRIVPVVNDNTIGAGVSGDF